MTTKNDEYYRNWKEAENKAQEFFQAHETLMVNLCEILKLDYIEATAEDVLKKVQELKDFEESHTDEDFRDKQEN